MEKKKNNQTEKIVLTWNETDASETARLGVMYCFHSCDLNRN